MDFQHLLERVAADAGADPDTVYREMQAALADAWQRRADSAEALALWEQLGFALACPPRRNSSCTPRRAKSAPKRPPARRRLGRPAAATPGSAPLADERQNKKAPRSREAWCAGRDSNSRPSDS